jgi:hypothetical protein
MREEDTTNCLFPDINTACDVLSSFWGVLQNQIDEKFEQFEIIYELNFEFLSA